MDALSPALPVTTAAGPATSAADGAALNADTDSGPVDFATLLAAGMLPPDAAAQAALKTDARLAEEDELAAETPADGALGAAVLLPLQAALDARSFASEQARADGTRALEAAELQALNKQASAGASLAGSAATFAAAAAADAELADATAFQALVQQEAAQTLAATGAAAESATASELAAHPLHIQGTEQRPVPQATAVLNVSTPVSGPGFADALSQQVVWMVDKDAQVAELHINPPELGPVEIRLTISGDEASAHFVSAHAEVRSALEASIARLRESMDQAGIRLGETSVGAESFRNQTASHGEGRDGRSAYGGERNGGDRPWNAHPAPTRTLRGLVDLFA